MGQQPLEALAPIRRPKFTSALVVAALLFVVALVASALYELNRSQREAQERAAHEIDSLARVFAEQTRRSLQTVDIMLRSVADAHHDGNLPPLDSRAMHDELAAQRDQFSDVTAVFVTDSQGERLNSSTAYPSPAGSVAGARLDPRAANGLARRRLRGRAGALADDRPLGPAAGSPARRPGRALRRRGGGAARRELLRQLLCRSAPGARHLGRAAARRRRPGVDVSAAGRAGRTARTGVPRPAAEKTPLRTRRRLLRDAAGGSDRIAVARPVPGFAMTVVVSRDLDEVLAAWREQVFWVALRTGILTLMMGALLIMVRRHVARVNAARAQLRESDQRYALAVAGSNEGLWDWNLVTGELFFSERAQQLCGMQPGPPLRPRRAWQACLTGASRGPAALARRNEGAPARPTAALRHRGSRGRAPRRRIGRDARRARVALVPPARPGDPRREGPAAAHGRLDREHR